MCSLISINVFDVSGSTIFLKALGKDARCVKDMLSYADQISSKPKCFRALVTDQKLLRQCTECISWSLSLLAMLRLKRRQEVQLVWPFTNDSVSCPCVQPLTYTYSIAEDPMS